MIIKAIVERPSGSVSAPRPPQPPSLPSPSSSGFPAVPHRSQRKPRTQTRQPSSAAEVASNVDAPHQDVSTTPERLAPLSARVTDAGPSRLPAADANLSEAERVRREVDEENTRRVEAMTDEEREQEARELTERFGPGLLELMRKRRAAREAKEQRPSSFSEAAAARTTRPVSEARMPSSKPKVINTSSVTC